MNMYDLIMKKKRGVPLDRDEIQWMIHAYAKGSIPDYQMSALLMAICFVGMDDDETLSLTLAMARSGDVLDLSSIPGYKVDKHSTGGVGDKTSLVLGPMVASLGIPVAKMSGRGLGHTGGTIDKLESIPGFSSTLTEADFIRQVRSIHMAIAGQTKDLAPADKKLYALRDVTGTVDQISLIASSIMSKKLASGADGIVLDVKTGDGAFMKTMEDSRRLAKEMVSIGRRVGKHMTAVISDMDQPLGYAVGNALEVQEAIDTLLGRGPSDLTELVLTLGSYMVLAAGKAMTVSEARAMLAETLHNHKAYQTFAAFVHAQGGDVRCLEDPSLLPQASYVERVPAAESGCISRIETEEIGRIVLELGGGRRTKDSVIDPAVGIVLHQKKGDHLERGDSLASIYANDKSKLADCSARLQQACHISSQQTKEPQIIKEIIQ